MNIRYYLLCILAVMPLHAKNVCCRKHSLKFGREGSLAYGVHGGYRKVPRAPYIRC